MNIAQFSVTRPVAVTMRIAALVLLGAVCLTKLPVDLLPKVSLPTVGVVTTWNNVAPEELETQITRPVEQAVSSTPNIYQVSSSTVEGTSTVRVQFQWGTDIGQAAVDVLQLVQRARQNFPNDPNLQTPVVYKYDPSSLPIMIFGVSGENDPIKLRTLLDNQVTPILESADGVASAVVTGGEKRAIIIDVDPDKLRAYKLSLSAVSKRISEENLNLPAGIAKQSDTEYIIRSTGYFLNPGEAGKIPVGTFNGQTVPLSAVATVRDSHQETRLYSRLNQEPAVGIIVTKQSNANTITTASAVQQKIEQIKKLYPNLTFRLAYDQSQFIEHSIEELNRSAIIGGGLAIIILLMFLRNFRSTLVVALSIPISIISTFTLLYLCGFTLNTISLSGLALATGLIVDDAVVVLENIFRHIERDKKRPAEASVSGTSEITSAVIASTFTIMVVFLPLFLLRGQSGQTFSQFALVVIFSIAVSLLDALTVVPMLASRLIRPEDVQSIEGHFEGAHEAQGVQGAFVNAPTNGVTNGTGNGTTHSPAPGIPRDGFAAPKRRSLSERIFDWFGRKFDELDQSYHRVLGWTLRHRFLVLGSAVGLTALSLLLVPLIGTELLPQTDSGDFTVNVKMPVGTALSKTDEVMKQVEQVLANSPDVETFFSAAGTTLSIRGTSTSTYSERGSATVRLKDKRKGSTADNVKRLQRELSKIPGARILVTPYDLVTQILTGGNQNIELDIFGPDINQLTALSKQVMDKARTIPGLESVDTNVQDATPELQWKVDRDKALQLGVSFSDIANTLNAATTGLLSSYYQEGGFQYPIYVQLPENRRKTTEQLLHMPLQARPTSVLGSNSNGTASGGSTAGSGSPQTTMIELGQVATPIVGTGPNEVTRQDRQRYIAITGRAQGRSESEIQADLKKMMDDVKMPQGYYWDFGTQQKRRREEFAGLGLAVFMAIALIYILLASQFESFIYPLVVLSSVPLSIIGVILGLFLTGRNFGLTAFIGLLMLIGIVVKNGILLVDYTNQLRGRGYKRDDAVLTASPTRLRPILMTSSAAILGMLPLAMGIGKGSETLSPLATAVIGGLTTSTLLTLFVVPVLYTLFDDLGRFFHKHDKDLARPEILSPSVEGVERMPGRQPDSQPEKPTNPVD